MTDSRTIPYWLDDGTEMCESCTHLHILQMEYRCVACDRPLCVHCFVIVRETHEVFCEKCHPEKEPA
ncbi:MAG TPA: hypothetical protein VFI91_00370 [Longimicrobiaceae bacterium]|nr:hypothetical protein [Longimicrobiaceae bacterium]